MPTPQAIQLAASIIAYGSGAAPAQFPKPDEIVIEVWADVLSEITIPEDVWPDAIKYWAAYNASDRMATPHQIVESARQVIKQWERDDSKKYILEAHRWKHRVHRAKKNYGAQFTLDKVVPPPYWSGIDTTKDPTGQDTLQLARESWSNAQKQPPEITYADADIIKQSRHRIAQAATQQAS